MDMDHWPGQEVLVVGLGSSGRAASRLLRLLEAHVTAIDGAATDDLRREAAVLAGEGIRALVGTQELPVGDFVAAVVSPGVPPGIPVMRAIRQRGIPVISELELGWRQVAGPMVAITGTNGKTTTTELVARICEHAGLKAIAAGNIGLPLCEVARRRETWDYLAVEASSFQLEAIDQFQPAVALLMNLTPDHLDRYDSLEDYFRAKGRIFKSQTPDQWAVVQWEAHQVLRDLGIPIAAQVITFSARADAADLFLDEGVIRSRWPGWPGPLLSLQQARLQGAHNVENMMAALGAALVLRLPLAAAVQALCSYQPAPHRCERVAEFGGVQFVNDSKATNVDAVRQALLAMPAPEDGRANLWLIAGGKDKGFSYGELGPVLASRVRGAFVLGETARRICGEWQRFTPCTSVKSLLEAVDKAGRQARQGDVILLSPACSSFDMFQNYQHRGEMFRQAVLDWIRQRTRCPQEIGAGAGEVRP